jgi:hypothetical protein
MEMTIAHRHEKEYQLITEMLAHHCLVDWPITVVRIVIDYYRHYSRNNIIMVSDNAIKMLPSLTSLVKTTISAEPLDSQSGWHLSRNWPRGVGSCAWCCICSSSTINNGGGEGRIDIIDRISSVEGGTKDPRLLNDRQVACGVWQRTNQLVIINQESISFLPIPSLSSTPSSSTRPSPTVPLLPVRELVSSIPSSSSSSIESQRDVGHCTCNNTTLESSLMPSTINSQESSADFRNLLTSGILHKDWFILVVGRRLEFLDLNTLKW